ncbi:MAG: GNAT family N-acetyltransferase [Pseudomonadota bacterium]
MSRDIAIRRPKVAEYEDITRIWFEAWHAAGLTHVNDLPFDALIHLFKRNAQSVWDLHVADIDGHLAGFLALIPEEKKLDQLFVSPSLQGRGVGKQLLDHAKRHLPNGLWVRTLATNHQAIRFYKQESFVFDRLEPRPEDDRQDMYLTWQP